MSSILAKKKNKNKPVYGWTQTEKKALKEHQRKTDALADMTLYTYYRIKEISMWILHDKFGYGKKRLERVHETTEAHLISYSDGELDIHGLVEFVKQKIGIDLSTEVRKIPQSERMFLAGAKIPKSRDLMISQMKSINGIIVAWFALICTALHTKLKLSKADTHRFIEECVEFFNTMKLGYVQMDELREALKAETGFELTTE